MSRFLSLLSLVSLSLVGLANAGSSCVAFDVSWNLLAFGFNGKDYSAGTQDSWASGTATDITTTGRPPFNGAHTSCYLSQFTNAIYVMGADTSSPSSVHIYDATAKSWSIQSVTTNGFDPASATAILDHDTNVFYALSKGEIFSLDMGLLKAANTSALSWTDVQNPGLGDNYEPVMALAQNHVHFLNVPDVAAGSAKIFVIHFSFMQPEPQSYGNFPATHGQATSFFKDTGVQQEFAFIPDDGSAVYVINVETNTTQTLKGPTVKDPNASYFASIDSLIQLSSSGSVSYIPYKADTPSANSAASWTSLSILPSAASSDSDSDSGSGSSGSGSSSGGQGSGSSGTPSGSARGAAATSGGVSATLPSISTGFVMGGAFVFAVFASLL
ncbi:hypothetical protein BDZ94DRAFT_1384292 [Collybia nuda]|uniref:Uncharacterized protein n=1 Tax=Collybia nuda TaxID=64659 RepID=A0A9P5XYR1_9AGAR|nr:hypothetical protein BDZ94DRAFT_1384292 [Collybia nuda]